MDKGREKLHFLWLNSLFNTVSAFNLHKLTPAQTQIVKLTSCKSLMVQLPLWILQADGDKCLFYPLKYDLDDK